VSIHKLWSSFNVLKLSHLILLNAIDFVIKDVVQQIEMLNLGFIITDIAGG